MSSPDKVKKLNKGSAAPLQQRAGFNGWWAGTAVPWLRLGEDAVLFGSVGLVAGFAVAVAPGVKSAAAGLNDERWLLICSLAGALAGLIVYMLYGWVTGRRWGLRVEEIEAPLIGTKIKIKVTDENRAVGWKIFVEATTRITTQPLGEREGLIGEALASMYKFFSLVRDELKNAKPSPPPLKPGSTQHTLESYAVMMLNDALRPMLARWHPRLTAWEKAGMPESLWPLKGSCRRDIEKTRQSLLVYTWGLGRMLKVEGLEKLLGEEPQQRNPPRLPAEDDADLRTLAWLESALSNTWRPQAWRVFVEAATRVAARPLSEGDGMLREELASLQKLSDTIRDELKSAPPPPELARAGAGNAEAPARPAAATNAPPAAPAEATSTLPAGVAAAANVAPRSSSASFTSCANRMLSEALHPMLARWGPRLAAWEKMGRPESQWPLAGACRRDLEATRKILLLELWEFGELLTLAHMQSLLPAKPDAAAPHLLTPAKDIAKVEATIWDSTGDPSKAAGWRMFVELVSSLAVGTTREKKDGVAEALTSLHELYVSVRSELKGVSPAGLPGAQGGDTVEGVALEILGGSLPALLAEWYPRLCAWQEKVKGAPASQNGAGHVWPQADACAGDLEGVRADLVVKARRLAVVLGLPADKFFGQPPGGAPPQATAG
jgi:hypothetical protein